jgi:hypothetical protein
MNSTPKSITNTTTGCPGTRDGDNGARVTPSTWCSEAGSINENANPQRAESAAIPDSSNQMRESPRRDVSVGSTSRPQYTPESAETPRENPRETTSIDRDGDNETQIDEEERRESWKKKWRKIKVTQAIKLGTLNIRGKNYGNGTSKLKNLTTIIRKH